MRLANKFFILVIFIFWGSSVHAQESYSSSHLTTEEIQRVKAVKELLDGVDTKPLWATIHELEKVRHPQINIEMMEAMAKAYMDIAREFNVQAQKKKQWLYSMVCLNMAYLQFGGEQGRYGSTTELNRLIRQKLKEYLPPDILNQPGFLYSLQ